jgi:hypothetical protein
MPTLSVVDGAVVALDGCLGGVGETGAVAFPSTTGAGFSSGVDEHPTTSPMTANISIHRFILSLLLSKSPPVVKGIFLPRLFDERTPCRLAHVASAFGETLLDATVAGHRG